MSNFHAALEIGTSRTVLAAGEMRKDGTLEITCHAEIPSTGVRKSQILSIGQATQSIRSVLKEIERNQIKNGLSLTVGNAFLVVSGPQIQVDTAEPSVPIARRSVTEEDIEALARVARTIALPRERELLDIIDRSYSVDELSGIIDPKGHDGRVLKLDVFHIHTNAQLVNDARTAAGEAKLELRDPLFAATCAADAVLSEQDRRSGTLVLDLGGGSTGYAAYCDSVLAATGTIGVGGDHVTNDIATAFQTTNAMAEELKKRESSAVFTQGRGERVPFPGATPLLENRTISRRALETVVNARMREIANMIRERLEEADLLHRLHGGIVLTGGGAALDGLDTLLKREFGVPVKIGIPENVVGLPEGKAAASFAAIAGALMYAHRNYEEKTLFDSLFGGIFK